MYILNLGTARSIIKTTNNFASPAADNELFLARTANDHARVKVVRYVATLCSVAGFTSCLWDSQGTWETEVFGIRKTIDRFSFAEQLNQARSEAEITGGGRGNWPSQSPPPTPVKIPTLTNRS